MGAKWKSMFASPLSRIMALDLAAPAKAEVAIWDAVGSDVVGFVLKDCGVKYTVIDTRGASLNLGVFVKAVLRYGIAPLLGTDKLLFYSAEYIRAVRAKAAVTFIDNHPTFWKLKILNPGLVTAFIQNGRRFDLHDIFEHVTIPSSEFHVDEMFVFNDSIGEYYKDLIRGRLSVVGSFKNNSVAVTRSDTSKSRHPSLLFISSWEPPLGREEAFAINARNEPVKYDDYYRPEEHALEAVREFARTNGAKVRVLGRTESVTGDEYRYYAERLIEFEFIPRTSWQASYEHIDRAEIVITTDSTLGYESLVRGSRVVLYSCRGAVLKSESSNFGWPSPMPERGPFWSSVEDREHLRSCLDFVATVSNEEWLRITRETKTLVMAKDEDNSVFRAWLKSVQAVEETREVGLRSQ
jgi:surface carbohydrate biosynthesis protein